MSYCAAVFFLFSESAHAYIEWKRKTTSREHRGLQRAGDVGSIMGAKDHVLALADGFFPLLGNLLLCRTGCNQAEFRRSEVIGGAGQGGTCTAFILPPGDSFLF